MISGSNRTKYNKRTKTVNGVKAVVERKLRVRVGMDRGGDEWG